MVTLLSPTHSLEPVESNARQRAAPAVLLLPPFTDFPVDTLNTFTCALLLPSWWGRSGRYTGHGGAGQTAVCTQTKINTWVTYTWLMVGLDTTRMLLLWG